MTSLLPSKHSNVLSAKRAEMIHYFGVTLANLRKRAGGIAMASFLEGGSLVARCHKTARDVARDLSIQKNISYGPRKAHKLDIYAPKHARAPLPVVFHVHGGGFRILSKNTHWMMAHAFAKQGFIVFNINYRLAPDHPFPAALEDTCLAYQWVLENASQFGGDPTCIVVAGESAGANLVSALTVAACFERPESYTKGVLGSVPSYTIPFCGMLQVSDVGRVTRRKKNIPTWLQDRMEMVSNGYLNGAKDTDMADPLLILESDTAPLHPLPPFFSAVGTRDPLLEDTRRLGRSLDKRNVRNEIHIYPNEVHAFHAFFYREAAIDCWNNVFTFLKTT